MNMTAVLFFTLFCLICLLLIFIVFHSVKSCVQEVEKERHEEIQKLLGEKSELDVKLEEYQIEEDKLVAKVSVE